MKDNFVLFPHFARSDAIKQYSSPTTDILANTQKQQFKYDSKRWGKWLDKFVRDKLKLV